ncbi:MAG: AAA family ATPase, partial [Candidatus Lokiarchaeota archaeon]|nr:AAA family ATPase [Candidatus Lokiarchaeota archaeon]
LVSEYDLIRDTQVVDSEKIIAELKKLIEKYNNEKKKYLIIESHFSDIVPNYLIDNCIVLRCEPDLLCERLKKRGYKEKKIIENVQAEILGNCVNYLIEKNLKIPIYEIDTSNKDPRSISNIIVDLILRRKKNASKYIIGKIDWLKNVLDDDKLARKYFYS